MHNYPKFHCDQVVCLLDFLSSSSIVAMLISSIATASPTTAVVSLQPPFRVIYDLEEMFVLMTSFVAVTANDVYLSTRWREQ